MTGSPYWVGVIVVGAIVAINVAIGGMRGVTYVQAFQFWLKVFAIAVPICILLIHFGGLLERAALFGRELPHAGSSGFTVRLDSPQRVQFPVAGSFVVGGHTVHVAGGRYVTLPANENVQIPPGGIVPVASGTTASAAGSGRARSAVPVTARRCSCTRCCWRRSWEPWGCRTSWCASTPTSDGHAARLDHRPGARAAVALLPVPGVLRHARQSAGPQLYVTGQTDDVVLKLPRIAWPGTVGTLLTAVTCAGAFAAFLSTSSGLLVSLAGTLSHDVWPRVRHRASVGRVACRRQALPGGGGRRRW